MCQLVLMVKQQNSSSPQLRFASYVYVATFAASCCTVSTTLFRILHVTFTVSCMTFLRVLQVTLTAPYSTIIVTLLQVVLVNFYCFVLHCQDDSFPDPSCNFHGFVHDVSQGPSSNSLDSVQHYHLDSSPSRSCSFCGFVLHCQHNFFRSLHVTFAASCTTFLWVFHVAVTASCCTVSTALL